MLVIASMGAICGGIGFAVVNFKKRQQAIGRFVTDYQI
jgi:hypothetical protein